jgi:acetoin utilization deacetylase AcuC-like enzyme
MIKIITDPRCLEYHRPGHPERPERISRTVERLRDQDVVAVDWLGPDGVDDATLLRAHTPAHLKRLAQDMDFDADTPAHPHIAAHARRSVGGALTALRLARQGHWPLSLLRPPGHHATADRAMGFCYLNSVAVAALDAQAGGVQRVAVLDFDVHHGNGTEAILHGRPGFAFFSVHQYPAYPGTGTSHSDNCFNYTVRPGAARQEYTAALQRALDDVRAFGPDLLCVSAGFDAYKADPLSDAPLEVEDYEWLGRAVRQFGVPVVSVLEGGYSRDLPELVFAYVRGLDSAEA